VVSQASMLDRFPGVVEQAGEAVEDCSLTAGKRPLGLPGEHEQACHMGEDVSEA
jgi:hypothetical protein